jgi:hypothetical protein
MKSKFVYTEPNEQYREWLKTNPIKKLTPSDEKKLDDEIRKKISDELNVTGEFDIAEFMLLHKWYEVREFVSKQDPKDIEEVKNLIWKPKGRSDFRRIVPELVLTSDSLDIKKINFWDEESYQSYTTNDKFIKHWNILRVLISSSRHDGTIGRQLRYLVRDKVTNTYLGIICISSSMMNLAERNKEVFGGEITKNKEAKQHFIDAFSTGGKSINMANGQTIMCCQPFGRYFNGGKLLALLCLTKQVANDWKERYGDTLVTVETTSLYGEKESTQYDGLKPFWRNLGKTSGDTPLKPTDQLWKELRRWLKKRYPRKYHHFMIQRNVKGVQSVRDKKNGMISRCYQLLGIGDVLKISSGHQRGVFLSKLYTNSDLFLQNKITESELIPSFDNSLETLVEFWKFGFKGDTKDSLHPELEKLASSKNKHSTKNSPAKTRLQTLINKAKEKGESPYIDLITDWYEPMSRLSLAETKKQFLVQISR